MKNQEVMIVLIKNILVALGAFQAAFYFTTLFNEPTSLVGALWSVISAYIVLEATPSEVYIAAKNRVIGSFIGAIVSGVFFSFFSFTFTGYVITIGAGVLVCLISGCPQSVKLSGITISVILIASTIAKDVHPITNAGLRFAESVIGTGVAVIVTLMVFYVEKSFLRKVNDSHLKNK